MKPICGGTGSLTPRCSVRWRDDQRDDSDIDILVDLDPEIVRTIFDYTGVKQLIAEMFDQPVDVVNGAALKPLVRPRANVDAIYAF